MWWNSNRVVCEQESSLARELTEADIHHGDDVEFVLEGVGVRFAPTAAHLCFCPARVEAVSMRKAASRAERAKPMPTSVRFSRQARRELARQLRGKHGFARLRINRFVSNGRMRVREVTVEQFEPVSEPIPVSRSYAYQDF